MEIEKGRQDRVELVSQQGYTRNAAHPLQYLLPWNGERTPSREQWVKQLVVAAVGRALGSPAAAWTKRNTTRAEASTLYRVRCAPTFASPFARRGCEGPRRGPAGVGWPGCATPAALWRRQVHPTPPQHRPYFRAVREPILRGKQPTAPQPQKPSLTIFYIYIIPITLRLKVFSYVFIRKSLSVPLNPWIPNRHRTPSLFPPLLESSRSLSHPGPYDFTPWFCFPP